MSTTSSSPPPPASSIRTPILKALETQSVKDKLREATAEAYERGVRGVPTIAVGDELFYGDDRLEEAGSALRAA